VARRIKRPGRFRRRRSTLTVLPRVTLIGQGHRTRVELLPDENDRTLARIETLSRGARANWFGLMAYLAFVGVTLLGVEDADFFLPDRQTALPLINVEIPTVFFFLAAPVLGTALYVYLHLHLMGLWRALATAPREIDGKVLGDRVFPWLANELALGRRPDHPLSDQPLRWVANFVTLVLVWVAGPVVLAMFWWASLPAHTFGMTLLIGLCLLVSIFVGLTGWLAFRWTMANPNKPAETRPGAWRGWRRKTLAGGVATLLLVAGAFWSKIDTDPAYALNDAIDWAEGVVNLARGLERPFDLSSTEDRGVFKDEEAQWDWVRRMTAPVRTVLQPLAPALRVASADLAEVELVPKPADWRSRTTARHRFRAAWCARHGIPPLACGETDATDAIDRTLRDGARARWCAEVAPAGDPPPTCDEVFARLDARFLEEWTEERAGALDALAPLPLRNRDLRRANLTRAFLANADLRGANLAEAVAVGAEFGGANLLGARLEDANLLGARFEGANLLGARFEGADLHGARFEGADLRGARFERAYLFDARLEGAELQYARFEGANLGSARFEGANLGSARFEGANLGGARFEGAYLGRARFEGADLSDAIFEGADLRDARFEGASLLGARFESAYLRGARFERAVLRRATFNHVHVGATTFARAQDLTQDQLATVVGDDDTILPRDAETGRPLHVWSCWRDLPPRIETLWRTVFGYGEDSIALLRDTYVCPPGTDPKPVGTSPSPEAEMEGSPGPED